MKHHGYWQWERVSARLNRRAEAAYDVALAIIIGIGLAALLVAWWSS